MAAIRSGNLDFSVEDAMQGTTGELVDAMIYVRVQTEEQISSALAELRAAVERIPDCRVVAEYSDIGQGPVGVRNALKQLLRDAAATHINLLVLSSLFG